jgi:hypothetical protein
MIREDQVIDPNQIHKSIKTVFGTYEKFIVQLHKRKQENYKEQLKVIDDLKKNKEERITLENKLAKLQREDSLMRKILSDFHGKKVDGKYLDASNNTLVDSRPKPQENLESGLNSPLQKSENVLNYLEMKRDDGVIDVEVLSETRVPRMGIEQSLSTEQLNNNDASHVKRNPNYWELHGQYNNYLERIKTGSSLENDSLTGKDVDEKKFASFLETLSPEDKEKVKSQLQESGKGMTKGDHKDLIAKALNDSKAKSSVKKINPLPKLISNTESKSKTKLKM